jgi:GTP-binding protein HflX
MKDSAILITYDRDDIIKEAVALCETAGFQVFKIIKQKFLNKAKYGLGEGKVEDLKEIVKSTKPNFIIFDEFLKPSQNYNLASTLKTNIIDRESLILRIFEHSATSAESKLQVKMAQLRYEMSHAKEKVRLAKKGEQPGFMGIGKFEVDVYYNDIKNRMNSIKSKLVKAGKQRALHRQGRDRIGFKTVSLAGYTSAGKTTLFNTLTGEMREENVTLFTTLSTTTRKIKLAETNVLISDTVGFISNLPAYMIEAFKSTLEELIYTDAVILVIDISDSGLELLKKFKSCMKALEELGVDYDKIIFVLNKSDLVLPDDIMKKAHELGLKENKKWLPVSATTGQNITQLKNLLHTLLESKPIMEKQIKPHQLEFEINYED